MTVSALNHARKYLPAQLHGGDEVEIDHGGKCGVVLAEQRVGVKDSGVVDEDVDRPDVALDLRDEASNRGADG